MSAGPQRLLRFRYALNSRGGIERYLVESSRELARIGTTTTLVSRLIPADFPTAPGLDTRLTPQYVTPAGSLSPRLAAEALRTRPHVVELHGLNSTSAYFHLAGPWVRLVYPYFHPDLSSGPRADHVRKRLKAARRWADALVLMTAGERDAIEELIDEDLGDVAVVPPGSERSGDTSSARERDLFLVVSRLEEAKHVDDVIVAAARAGVLDRLRVVGHGPDRDRLVELLTTFGVSPAEVLVGRVDDAELDRLRDRARLLVSMSRSESYGITLAEGLAAGAAVVASGIPAHRAVLASVPEEYCELVQEGDIEHLAVHFAAPPQLPPVGAYVRPWADVAAELDALYRQIAARKRRFLTGRRGVGVQDG